MKKIATILLFLTLSISVFAQDEAYFDSLETKLATMSNDTLKLEMLFGLLNDFEQTAPIKVIVYGQEALDLATKQKNNDRIIRVSYRLGKAYNRQNQPKLAVDFLGQSIDNVKDSVKYWSILKEVYSEKGAAHLELREYTSARVFFQKALKIFEKKRRKRNIAKAEYNIGEAFLGEGDLKRAIVFFKRSERTYDAVKSPENVIKSMVKTGLTYLEMGDDNLALSSFKKAIARAKRAKKDKAVGIAKQHLGKFYFNKTFYRESLKWQKEALYAFQEANDTVEYAKMLSESGLTYIELDSLETGFNNELEALRLLQLTGNLQDLAHSLNNLGKHYVSILGVEPSIGYLKEASKINLQLNKKADYTENQLNLSYLYFQNGDYPSVLTHANAAMLAAQDGHLQLEMQKAALLLSNTYRNTGQFEKAYQSRHLFDSLYVEASKFEMEKLTKQIEKSQVNYEEAVISKDSVAVYKYLFWTVLPMFLASFGLAMFFFFKLENRDPKQMKAKIKSKLSKYAPPKLPKKVREKVGKLLPKNKGISPAISKIELPKTMVDILPKIVDPVLTTTPTLPAAPKNEPNTGIVLLPFVQDQLKLLSSIIKINSLIQTDDLSVRELKMEQSRLQAIYLLQRQLQQKGKELIDFQYYCEELVYFLDSTHHSQSAIINYSIQSPHKVDIKKAIPLGLILTELLSNIIIHAFDHQLNGEIKIDLSKNEDNWHLKVSNNGKDLNEAGINKQSALGLKIVNLLAKHLNSKLENGRENDWTVFEIKFT